MVHSTLPVPVDPADEQLPRFLDGAVRVSLAGIVAGSVLLEGATETQPYFYAVMLISLTIYVLVRGERLLPSLFDYLTSSAMLWRWAFVVWAVASLLWTARGTLSIERAITLLEIQMVGLIFFDAARRLNLARYVLALVFVAAVVGALHAMITSAPGTLRLHGLFKGPNYMAIAAVLAMIGFLAGAWEQGRRTIRALSHVGALSLLGGILAAASLKGMAGAVFVTIATALNSKTRKTAAVFALVAVLAGTSMFLLLRPASDYWEHSLYRIRITAATVSSSNVLNESATERSRFIREGLGLISEAPIVGRGLDTFRWLSGEGAFSHNNYIELGVSLGLVGVILYYGLHVALILRALKSGVRSRLVGRYTLVLVAVILMMDFAAVSYNLKLSTFLMILCAGWLGQQPSQSDGGERPAI